LLEIIFIKGVISMGVGVTCPKCSTTFASCCTKCSSYELTIFKGFAPEKYFQTRSIFYLKCRACQAEYEYILCPDCQTKIFPTAPFVRGDSDRNLKGCFIATACVGTNSPILAQLYLFRDEFLTKNCLGRKFIKYYYACSPLVASWVRKSGIVKSLSKFLVVFPGYYLSIAVMKIHTILKKNSCC
jgi:hypothetical protein